MEHQLEWQVTPQKEDSVPAMQSQSDYTIAHMPRPQNAKLGNNSEAHDSGVGVDSKGELCCMQVVRVP